MAEFGPERNFQANFKSGRIKERNGYKWAEALAVHKKTGRIIAIGSNTDILAKFSQQMAEHVLDFKQRSQDDGDDDLNIPLIVPGFIDAHAHVILGGKVCREFYLS